MLARPTAGGALRIAPAQALGVADKGNVAVRARGDFLLLALSGELRGEQFRVRIWSKIMSNLFEKMSKKEVFCLLWEFAWFFQSLNLPYKQTNYFLLLPLSGQLTGGGIVRLEFGVC